MTKSKIKSFHSQENKSTEEVTQELKYKAVSCRDTEILFDSTARWSSQDRTVYELLISMFPAFMERMEMKPLMRECVVENNMMEDEENVEEEADSVMFLAQFHEDSSSDEEFNDNKDEKNENTDNDDRHEIPKEMDDKQWSYRERLEVTRTALTENPDVSKRELAKLLTEKKFKPLSESVLRRIKPPHLDQHTDLIFNGHHYAGRVSRLTLQGEGILKLSNGTRYEGNFYNNTLHGEGRLEWSDGSWYEGNFKDNHRQGYGLHRSKDNPQEVYIGHWFQGQRQGFGCQYYSLSEDDFYEGEFRCNKRVGQGLRRWEDGQTYAGSWEHDMIHGFGVMRFNNGSYSGQWSQGLMQGHGTYIWTSGSMDQMDNTTVGTQLDPRQVMNGKAKKHSVTQLCKHSSMKGTLSLARSYNIYEGQWRRGQRHGEGVLTSASGIKFRGTWVKNKKQGHGVLIRPNGTVISQVTCVDDVMYLKSESSRDTLVGEYQPSCYCPRLNEVLINPDSITKQNSSPSETHSGLINLSQSRVPARKGSNTIKQKMTSEYTSKPTVPSRLAQKTTY